MDENHPLHAMVERSKHDPFFLGYYVHRIAQAHGWDDQATADAVGCSPDRLHLLYLCRWPMASDAQFDEHVQRIAEYVPCNEPALRNLLDGSAN